MAILVALILSPAVAADTFLANGVTAHRGDSSAYPENTMPAIERALALGVDWIEIDIFQTGDGVLVVTHDATTGRVGDRDLPVAESTLAQLREVDVAAGSRAANALTLAQCPPAAMPTLKEVIARIVQQRRTRLSIQPKMDVVDAAIALIREMGAGPWVGFNDGDLAKMRRVKELSPEIPVFWDRNASFPLEKDLQTARELGFEALVVNHAGLTPEVVSAIRDAGFEAGAWTVNDADTMRDLLRMGVQRIYTDVPDRLLEILAEE